MSFTIARSRLVRPLSILVCVAWLALLNASAVAGEEANPFTRPPELERDVRFWIRVYTEVTTDQGLLHDDWNLGLVYEVLRFDPTAPPAERERRVAEAKARYAALLRRFAAGATSGLTPHERRILRAFGDGATARQFLDAIDHIRFQLGQADRFHEGLIRAEAWEAHIARVLEQHGVPAEIAALPHVESSFNPAAYSKVGAAGLWQFMPSTAKRFMRVDGIVDERMDPYSATEAAANLMLYNYRLLGTWPLTVTAYNHGPGGLRRAQEQLGTSDIAVIVKRYQGATFGFASRNFYVSFLAALEVDRNAAKYFGPITRLPDTENTPVEVPDYIPVDALAKAFKVDRGALQVLNPALRPPIWSGARLVPRGYALRLPGSVSESAISAAWARLPPSQHYLAQRNDGNHRVRRGENLAGIASASGVSVARLLAANGWSGGRTISRGEIVRIPMPSSRADTSAAAPAPPALASNGPRPADTAAPEAPPAAAPPMQSPAAAPEQSPPEQSPPEQSPPTPQPAAQPPQPSQPEPQWQLEAPAQLAAHPRLPAAVSQAPAQAAPLFPETIELPPVQSANMAVPKEPVSQRQTGSVALLPAGTPTGNADITDYTVAADNTVVVRADETLGHLAHWSGVDSQALRVLNKLRKNSRVALGRRIKLDLSRVSAAQFVAARREYHRQLQESYFAAHRIAGTVNYNVK
ncbi:MAG TPA: transglycosylase SLT domain-containing protein, partial [Pseudomonadota bacterium]|nr:transglycosylase SLT domain-containing protein [Pseudomonadota bacterium]